LDLAIQGAYDISIPTHGTNIAIAGAGAVACAIAQALDPNSTLESIIWAARKGAALGAQMGRVVWGSSLEKRIQLAQRLVEQAENEKAALQALYDYIGVDLLVSESVAAALGIIWLANGDPVKAILMSANLGGDTDTIGAIAGSICGAWKGAKAFPPAWIETLERINHLKLIAMAEELAEIVTGRFSTGYSDSHL
jgi:ADP-ribosylglycohydrolase